MTLTSKCREWCKQNHAWLTDELLEVLPKYVSQTDRDKDDDPIYCELSIGKNKVGYNACYIFYDIVDIASNADTLPNALASLLLVPEVLAVVRKEEK